MKKPFLLLVAGVFLIIGLFVFFQKIAVKQSTEVKSTNNGLVLTTYTDPTMIFQKAFWRRPDSGDKILHAERREWSDRAKEVREWQWFLVVKPSPALTEWFQTNPFSLTSSKQPMDNKDSVPKPEWFPKDFSGFDVQKAPHGHLVMIFSAEKNLLYAMDSGAGFTSPTHQHTN
jgi:hypothetical protein